MKVCVCGSRSIVKYETVASHLSLLKEQGLKFTQLVSGCCRGPDLLAETWAETVGVNIIRFPALWKRFGLSAGPIRNKQMADYSDIVIAFYDGKSAGTKQMIQYCKEINREIKVIQCY